MVLAKIGSNNNELQTNNFVCMYKIMKTLHVQMSSCVWPTCSKFNFFKYRVTRAAINLQNWTTW